MDTGEILKKLEAAVPGSVLEKSRFGRTSQLCVWVEGRKLAQAAAFLKAEPGVELDWVENLSAVQMEESLVATYFLRSQAHGHSLVMRASVVPSSASREVDLPTVTGVWPMAGPFESEIQELFGIQFMTEAGEPAHSGGRLPKGWTGFPLRKGYIFPTEFLGIPHSRKAGADRRD